MMNCDQALELISASLDQPLTQDEQQALDQHLADCPDCRALLADFQKIHQELSGMTVEPPAALCQGVMDRIKAQESTEKVVPFRRKPRPWVRWGAAAAVFAVVLLSAGSAGMLDIVRNGTSGSAAAPAATQQTQSEGQETTADTASAPQCTQPVSTPQQAERSIPQVTSEQGESAAAPSVESREAESTNAQSTPAVTQSVQPSAAPQPVTGFPAGDTMAIPEGDSSDPSVYQQAAPMPTASLPETVMVEPASNEASIAMTEEEARQRLQNWLNAQESSKAAASFSGGADANSNNAIADGVQEDVPQLTPLGQSEDGSSWLFAVENEDGVAHYAVPMDGGEIYPLEETN